MRWPHGTRVLGQLWQQIPITNSHWIVQTNSHGGRPHTALTLCTPECPIIKINSSNIEYSYQLLPLNIDIMQRYVSNSLWHTLDWMTWTGFHVSDLEVICKAQFSLYIQYGCTQWPAVREIIRFIRVEIWTNYFISRPCRHPMVNSILWTTSCAQWQIS